MDGMSRIASRRPAPDELPDPLTDPYRRAAVDHTPGDDVLMVLDDQLFWLCELAGQLSPMVVDVVHPPYRWTIRQVFSHGIETERVFGFRMQSIAAGDPAPMAGFDQDDYAAAKYGLGNFSNLVTEWGYTRMANLLLLRRIAPRCWDHSGTFEGGTYTLRTVAWLTAGHLRHHLDIVEQRIGRTVRRAPPNEPSKIIDNAETKRQTS